MKKEAGIAERKLLARNERIQNLETLLQDADRRLAVQNQKFEAQLQQVKERLDQARGESKKNVYRLSPDTQDPFKPKKLRLPHSVSGASQSLYVAEAGLHPRTPLLRQARPLVPAPRILSRDFRMTKGECPDFLTTLHKLTKILTDSPGGMRISIGWGGSDNTNGLLIRSEARFMVLHVSVMLAVCRFCLVIPYFRTPLALTVCLARHILFTTIIHSYQVGRARLERSQTRVGMSLNDAERGLATLKLNLLSSS